MMISPNVMVSLCLAKPYPLTILALLSGVISPSLVLIVIIFPSNFLILKLKPAKLSIKEISLLIIKSIPFLWYKLCF